MEDGFERGIVVVGVVADDGDGFAVVVGGLAMIAAGFADHAEAVVAVMDIGEAREQVVGGLFGGIEITGLDHVYHGVGCLGQFVAFVDPFVRLHRIDENVSGDVAPLLAFLRELQRRHAVAIAVVHHARKGAGTLRAGQALRGSYEFHAWGDSNLYLRRDTDDRIALTVEHRAAAAIAGITLALTQRDNALALQPADADHQIEPRVQATSIDQRIAAALAEGEQPRTFAELRASCRVRAKTLYQRIAAMTAAGIVTKSANGYSLTVR